MCGIAGIVAKNIDEKEKVIGDMVSAITHRGPDENGYFVDSDVALGMRRLSIIDLSTGKQPIFSADGKKLIFFNGEIYNYRELRDELSAKGCAFKTDSDTEVILVMFEMYGEKMLTRLRGMFAFCIYNTETKKVFLARDFFGIKPLYYLVSQDNLEARPPSGKVVAFSSEIKSFLSIPGFKAEVNNSAVVNYLSFQYNPLTETFFKGVYKLPPAHFMEIDMNTGETVVEKYWAFEFNQQENLDEKTMSGRVLDTITDSVKHHMIADVPVGSFLSGGVDSSIIAILMQKIRGGNPASPKAAQDGRVKTFTVGFDTLTEGAESKQTSDFLQTDHTEITIGADEYFKALPDAVWHFDEPVADPSAIGLYFLSREASKHVKVVLSGEGADELFGGYNIYLAPFAYQRLAWLPKSIIELFLKLPFEFFGKNYLRRVNSKLENWYIGNASIFSQNEIKNLWKKEMSKRHFDISGLYKKAEGLSDSTKMQYVDIHTWLVGDVLAKADKMTMAHSLELRVPFLDIEVANLARTLPDNLKWRSGIFWGLFSSTTKYILRKAFAGIIPESTRNRKKLGFPTPLRHWLTADPCFVETTQGKQNIFNVILENEYIVAHMNTAHIQTLIDDHTSGETDNSRKIYTLLMLALWYDVFIKTK